MVGTYYNINSNWHKNYCFIEYLDYEEGLDEIVRDETGANSIFIVKAGQKGILLNIDYSKKSYNQFRVKIVYSYEFTFSI